MTTFTTKAFDNVKPITLPDAARPQWIAVDVEFKATAYASTDLIRVCALPARFKVLDAALMFPDCDSGGSALAFTLGTENALATDLDESWIVASTAAGTGVPARMVLTAAPQGAITADRNVILKCTTIATTYAGSGKIGQVLLLVQG